LAMEYVAAQNAKAQLHLTPQQAENFGQFIEYLLSTWFDSNSAHFVGKWSNYFPLVSRGQFTVTNLQLLIMTTSLLSKTKKSINEDHNCC